MAPLNLQIDSDADGEYTITLVNATHHPFPTQTTFIATNYLAILPFETTLRIQYLKMLPTRPHAAMSSKFMREVKDVLTKLADFKEKMRKLRREVKPDG